jgi:DNA-binding SARP family transcriptional activator
MVEVGFLGPLLLVVDGEPVGVGPVLSVLVLALVCAQGRLVPAAQLGALLAAPGGAPTTAATVRSHVSHLRKALGDGHGPGREGKVLVSGRAGGSTGYALRAEAIETDMARFVEAVSDGRAELAEGNFRVAAQRLREGTVLWRGDPLSDAEDRPFARDHVEHLTELHRRASLALAAADIGAGRHRDVLGELERMVRRWPDDEDIRALQAIALYRSGRPVGAADACREAVRAARAHGLESPRLRELQRTILSRTLPETVLPYLPGVG